MLSAAKHLSAHRETLRCAQGDKILPILVGKIQNRVPTKSRHDRFTLERHTEQPMPKAIWNGAVLAQSDKCIVVEGNQYFPPDAVNREYFKDSIKHTTCPWKGLASYYTIEVDGKENKDAAWFYPDPKEAAKQIQDYVAFWRGVKVEA